MDKIKPNFSKGELFYIKITRFLFNFQLFKLYTDTIKNATSLFQVVIYFSMFCIIFLIIATYIGPDNEQLKVRHRRDIERKPTFLELIKRNVIKKCEQSEHNHDHKPTFIELIKKSSVRECDKNEGIQSSNNYIQRLENLYYESFPKKIGDNDEDDVERNLKEVEKRKSQIFRGNQILLRSERFKRNIFNPSHLNPTEVHFQSMEDKNRLRRQAQQELAHLQTQYTRCKKYTPYSDCNEIYDKFATLANEINMKFSEISSILKKMDGHRDSDEEKQIEVIRKFNKKKGKKLSSESDEVPLPTIHNHVIRLKPNQTQTSDPQDPIESSTTETSVTKDETIATTTETSVAKDETIGTTTETIGTTTETTVTKNEIIATTTETSVAKDDLITTTETSVAKDEIPSQKIEEVNNTIPDGSRSNNFFATPKIHEDLNDKDSNKKWYSDIKTQHMTMEQFIKSKTGHFSRNSDFVKDDTKKSDRAEQNNAQITTNVNTPKDNIKFLCKLFFIIQIFV